MYSKLILITALFFTTNVFAGNWFVRINGGGNVTRKTPVGDLPMAREGFSIFRSMRKGSASRATEVGISARDIDLINRWRNSEKQGKRNLPMRDYYLDLLLVKKRLLRYSECL